MRGRVDDLAGRMRRVKHPEASKILPKVRQHQGARQSLKMDVLKLWYIACGFRNGGQSLLHIGDVVLKLLKNQ